MESAVDAKQMIIAQFLESQMVINDEVCQICTCTLIHMYYVHLSDTYRYVISIYSMYPNTYVLCTCTLIHMYYVHVP